MKSSVELQERISHLEGVIELQFAEAVELKKKMETNEKRVAELVEQRNTLMEMSLDVAKRDVAIIGRLSEVQEDKTFLKGVVNTLRFVVDKSYKVE